LKEEKKLKKITFNKEIVLLIPHTTRKLEIKSLIFEKL
jgi:hypothetical protein